MFKKVIVTYFFYLIIDLPWLGIAAKKFYDQALSPFKRTLNWPAALLVYFLLSLGIVIFPLPIAKEKSLFFRFLIGALFGLIAYGTYDLSNLATLADWQLKTTVVDMLWGAVLIGSLTLIISFLFPK